MEKKSEGDREAAGEVFLASDPYITVFWYWRWEMGAAKVALLASLNQGGGPLWALMCEGTMRACAVRVSCDRDPSYTDETPSLLHSIP
jgi:hypothetical protein